EAAGPAAAQPAGGVRQADAGGRGPGEAAEVRRRGPRLPGVAALAARRRPRGRGPAQRPVRAAHGRRQETARGPPLPRCRARVRRGAQDRADRRRGEGPPRPRQGWQALSRPGGAGTSGDGEGERMWGLSRRALLSWPVASGWEACVSLANWQRHPQPRRKRLTTKGLRRPTVFATSRGWQPAAAP